MGHSSWERLNEKLQSKENVDPQKKEAVKNTNVTASFSWSCTERLLGKRLNTVSLCFSWRWKCNFRRRQSGFVCKEMNACFHALHYRVIIKCQLQWKGRPRTGWKHRAQGNKGSLELEGGITAVWRGKRQASWHVTTVRPGMNKGTTGQMYWPICTRWRELKRAWVHPQQVPACN